MMTGIGEAQSNTRLILMALLVIGMSASAACAATTVSIKNNGPIAVQIAFDGMAPIIVAARGSARLSLNDGEHSAQCRFEGYDGCNMADRFTIEGAREMILNLVPIYTAEHAVALAGQGKLSMETRPDVWATTTLDVQGAAEECLDFSAGKLASVSRRMQARVAIRNATVATQNLCGRPNAVIGTMMEGAQVYFPLRFVLFKESNGRPVLVRP